MRSLFMMSKDPLVSNIVFCLVSCCLFVIFVVLGSWYCGLFERICIVQTIGERCSMCTVPSSSCFGMVASRDCLHQKRQLNHLWLRPAVGGQQKLFDCVRVNKISSSLEKCWFRKALNWMCVVLGTVGAHVDCEHMFFRFSTITLLLSSTV